MANPLSHITLPDGTVLDLAGGGGSSNAIPCFDITPYSSDTSYMVVDADLDTTAADSAEGFYFFVKGTCTEAFKMRFNNNINTLGGCTPVTMTASSEPMLCRVKKVATQYMAYTYPMAIRFPIYHINQTSGTVIRIQENADLHALNTAEGWYFYLIGVATAATSIQFNKNTAAIDTLSFDWDGTGAVPLTMSDEDYPVLVRAKTISGLSGYRCKATPWSQPVISNGKMIKIATNPSSYSTVQGGFKPSYRVALTAFTVNTVNQSPSKGDLIYYNNYYYYCGYVDSSYAYLSARYSISGPAGSQGATGPQGPAGGATYYVEVTANNYGKMSWKDVMEDLANTSIWLTNTVKLVSDDSTVGITIGQAIATGGLFVKLVDMNGQLDPLWCCCARNDNEYTTGLVACIPIESFSGSSPATATLQGFFTITTDANQLTAYGYTAAGGGGGSLALYTFTPQSGMTEVSSGAYDFGIAGWIPNIVTIQLVASDTFQAYNARIGTCVEAANKKGAALITHSNGMPPESGYWEADSYGDINLTSYNGNSVYQGDYIYIT